MLCAFDVGNHVTPAPHGVLQGVTPNTPFSLGYHNTLENLVPGVPHVVCQGMTPQHHVLLWFCSLTEKHLHASLTDKYRHTLSSMSSVLDRTPQHHLFSGCVFYGVTHRGLFVMAPILITYDMCHAYTSLSQSPHLDK